MALCGLFQPSVDEISDSNGSDSIRAKANAVMQPQTGTGFCIYGKKTTRERFNNAGRRIKKLLGMRRKGTPDDPLIPRNSGNIFHDQALIQLASVYESLQLGDSREAVTEVWDLGQRIFGRELFERTVQDGRLTGLTS